MDQTRKTLAQASRFLLVSGVSLAIDYGVYSLLSQYSGLSSSWAKRVSFACIFIWGYFAHKHFTFQNRGFNASEPIRFTLLYLTGWALNSVVHDVSASQPGASDPAFLAATFVWAIWNFAGQKLFVFRHRREDESQTERES
ncbi:GtrA family protein [Pelagicoccus albus]|uniref:GtrA family protein n=1 Tax=Pelagicoccus albus TaxID=415222 RepID=A0A7X1B840_9BACT|nr:GtrA family protein [Pelagicoccus albus]MBC2607439.1 GtrA family protein [Pelagicoccus albus]